MLRSNATWIITFVTNKETLGYLAKDKFIRKSMGSYVPFISWFCRIIELSIAIFIFVGRPFPAFMKWNHFDFIPESLHAGFVANEMRSVHC